MENKKIILDAIDNVTCAEKCDYNSLIKNAKHRCIFGLGNMLKDCWSYFQGNIRIDYFCDNNPQKWGQYYYGIKCISPEELKILEDAIVIIAVSAYKEVSIQLHEMGIKYVNYFNVIWDKQENEYGNYWLKKQEDKILLAYDLMDEDSKKIYTELFCNRIEPISAKRKYSELNCKGMQYFDLKKITLRSKENYVDCGAYDGDTIDNFLKAVKNQFNHIYAFEIDTVNYKKLGEFLATLDYSVKEKISTYNLGTWSKKIWLECDETNDMQTRVTEFGKNKISMNKLDEILKDKDISFIKMDIEGAEIETLKGACKLITEQGPKLAVCIYHKLSDLWEIPLLLNSMNTNYRFALKHYSDYWSETVCYAY